MSPDCPGKARRRGLCDRCYGAARDLVYGKRATWAELEAMGLCVPAKPKQVSKFMENYRALKPRKTGE